MQKAIQIPYNDLFKLKCECAAEAGFRHIAVNFNPLMGKTEDEWKQITEEIQGVLAETNLQCVQSHLCEYDLLSSSEIEDEDRYFGIRQSIIASGKLGAEYGVFHPRTSISSGYRSSKSLEDNKALLGRMLECAYQQNVSIAVENIPIFSLDNKMLPFFSSNFEDLAALVDSVSDERVVICWDFGHANLMAWKQSCAIGFLGSRIRCTHIHNNFGGRDDHSTPDIGSIDWKDAMTALAATGFDGPLTLETHCGYTDAMLLRSFVKHNYACVEILERMMNKN